VNREAKVTAVSQFHTKLVFIEMPKPLLALSISRKDPRSPNFLLKLSNWWEESVYTGRMCSRVQKNWKVEDLKGVAKALIC